MLWTASSALRGKLAEQEILKDKTEYLLDYRKRTARRVDALRRLLELAPSTSARVKELAKVLEESKNYLQVRTGYRSF